MKTSCLSDKIKARKELLRVFVCADQKSLRRDFNGDGDKIRLIKWKYRFKNTDFAIFAKSSFLTLLSILDLQIFFKHLTFYWFCWFHHRKVHFSRSNRKENLNPYCVVWVLLLLYHSDNTPKVFPPRLCVTVCLWINCENYAWSSIYRSIRNWSFIFYNKGEIQVGLLNLSRGFSIFKS